MDLSTLWDRLLVVLRERIGGEEVSVWFGGARIHALDGDQLVIRVSNGVYAGWIDDNYRDVIVAAASELIGHPVQLVTEAATGNPALPITPAAPSPVAGPRLPRAVGVNTDQTFAAFVVGECNRFAHAAAAAVADHPAQNYNPLFIYGSTGLGKTHLMHAIANQVLLTPGARVVYVTAEDFTNEMINGIRFERMNEFREKYRSSANVLLVDDVQFLSGKERTQEEFFFTFNALLREGRQIVLTSDVVPRDIRGLEPRLRTRFEGGLLADMQPPDPETLLAILRQKADAHHLAIPPDLAHAIVDQVAGNVRELEGLLNRLAALHSLYGEPLTLAFARERMPALFDRAPPELTVGAIIETVARMHNLRSADLTGGKRTQALTRPRHLAMYLARKHTSLSFPELGREFGGRDHSTVQHGYRKVDKELVRDADLQHKVQLLEQALKVRAR